MSALLEKLLLPGTLTLKLLSCDGLTLMKFAVVNFAHGEVADFSILYRTLFMILNVLLNIQVPHRSHLLQDQISDPDMRVPK